MTIKQSFSQMDQNTVDSKNQLKDSALVRFEHLEGEGKRILLCGNSITLHGPKADIGWHGEWGMAASAKEKDYAHLLMEAILEKDAKSAFCICQVADWERQYKTGEETYPLYQSARDFDADLIIMRFIENCPKKEFDSSLFIKELDAFLSYLNPSKKAKIILTTGFWAHPGDEGIMEYAKAQNLPCIYLGDLGEQDQMKAIGLFEHSGVAAHPGDLGMSAIAERIYNEAAKILF
ncbi:MAG: SGNH/GDSL hydrolase family protein [Clostridia bacterium]|nr:SGNH/GDSL hydrolase family protein [Clostridia bacterium]